MSGKAIEVNIFRCVGWLARCLYTIDTGLRKLGKSLSGFIKSVDVNSASMNDYLRSEVFFNVTRFPDMRFVSTSVEKRDENHARVTGDLTMLGVTRPISLDVEVARKLAGTNQRVGFKATGVINRLDFGMNSGYPLISDAIHLTVTTDASAEP